jgi:hypothetical protein
MSLLLSPKCFWAEKYPVFYDHRHGQLFAAACLWRKAKSGRAGFHHVGIDVTPECAHLYTESALFRIQHIPFMNDNVQHHATGVQAISGCAVSSTQHREPQPFLLRETQRGDDIFTARKLRYVAQNDVTFAWTFDSALM